MTPRRPAAARRGARQRPPADIEPKFVSVNGAGIFHYDAGSGAPVLLLHGLNHHADAWKRNIAALSGAGYRVIAPDLPGFGRSGVPDISYSLSGYAGFLMDFLDAVGAERVHLVGNSMGGAIALQTALDVPGRVISVTGVDPAGIFEEVPWIWSLAGAALVRPVLRPLLGRRRLLRESHRRAFHDPSVADPEHVAIIADAYRQPGYRDHILRMAETMFKIPAEDLPWPRLGELEMPVLIVWGRQDRTISVRHAYRAALRIPAAEVVIYEGCGHLPMFEKPDDFNRDLLDFLARASDREQRGGDMQ